ncbi:hypothetical protein CSKR_107738 [Clonorchis sinensis]|uniref:Uncharacterized protein n=1 Tax=Clonorchis sinensis TaxID=79923 RepID=A0A3R7H6T8_CLOSI|nr:hypothetical protein CSKR_107738 [Clonorchis sinensis]
MHTTDIRLIAYVSKEISSSNKVKPNSREAFYGCSIPDGNHQQCASCKFLEKFKLEKFRLSAEHHIIRPQVTDRYDNDGVSNYSIVVTRPLNYEQFTPCNLVLTGFSEEWSVRRTGLSFFRRNLLIFCALSQPAFQRMVGTPHYQLPRNDGFVSSVCKNSFFMLTYDMRTYDTELSKPIQRSILTSLSRVSTIGFSCSTITRTENLNLLELDAERSTEARNNQDVNSVQIQAYQNRIPSKSLFCFSNECNGSADLIQGHHPKPFTLGYDAYYNGELTWFEGTGKQYLAISLNRVENNLDARGCQIRYLGDIYLRTMPNEEQASLFSTKNFRGNCKSNVVDTKTYNYRQTMFYKRNTTYGHVEDAEEP